MLRASLCCFLGAYLLKNLRVSFHVLVMQVYFHVTACHGDSWLGAQTGWIVNIDC